MEKQSQNGASVNSGREKRQPTKLIWSKEALVARLAKGPEARRKFVESQIVNEVVSQIRGLRHKNEWSQPALAEKIRTTQNQIYRLENTRTAKPTLTTLKKLAAAFDVGLVVRFVPFGEMIDYLSGTPRWDAGISTSRQHPPSFPEELAAVQGERAKNRLLSSSHMAELEYRGKPKASGLPQLSLPLAPENVVPIDWTRKSTSMNTGICQPTDDLDVPPSIENESERRVQNA
jgi:ribosome-binding protein aMBF1 (putative translation factor)